MGLTDHHPRAEAETESRVIGQTRWRAVTSECDGPTELMAIDQMILKTRSDLACMCELAGTYF